MTSIMTGKEKTIILNNLLCLVSKETLKTTEFISYIQFKNMIV